MAMRLALTAWVGPGLPTYITFYPAVILAAIVGGFGPGFVATILVSLCTVYWILPPQGQFAIASLVDIVGLMIFFGMGIFVSVLAEFYQRSRAKAAAYDKELALRKSEERMRFALEVSHTGAWDLDLVDHTAVRSFEHDLIFGYTEPLSSWTYEIFIEHVLPQDREIVSGKFRHAIENKSDWDFECRIRRADGAVRWIHAVGQHHRDISGKARRMAGIVQDITERKYIEDVLKFLAQSASTALSEDFFKTLARYLGQALDMDFVCIDRLKEGLLAAETVAIYFDGKFDDNVSYALKDTPCGDVVGKGVCCFAKGVRQLFPKDAVLQEMLAESYVGTTLWGSQGQPIGLIAVIGRKPLSDTKLAISVLQLVAVRAAGELERRQVEDALLANEEKARQQAEELAALFEAVPTPVFIAHDVDCLHITGNKLADEILRVSHGDELSMSALEATRPRHFRVIKDGRELRLDELPAQRAARGDHVKGLELTLVFDDGVIRHVLGYGTPLLDKSGDPRGALAVLVDITERKHAEEELKKSEERYRSLFNTLIEGFCIVEMVFDRDGKPIDYRFLEVNPAFEAQTGLHDATGKLMRELAPEHEDHWFEVYGKVALTGTPVQFINEARALNRWYEVYAFRVGGQDSRKVAICFNDITARRLAEKSLEETRNYLENLFDYANAPIIVWDPAFKITRFNHAFEKMTGYAADEVIGKDLEILFAKESLAKSLEEIASTLAGEYWETIEIPIRQKDGHVRIVLWNSANIYAKDGKSIVSTIAQGQDITERKHVEEALDNERRNLQAIFDSTNVGLLLVDSSGSVKRINSTVAAWFGKDLTQVDKGNPGDIIGCMHAHGGPKGCGHASRCADCSIRNAFESALRLGQPVHNVETQASLLIDGAKSDLWLAVSADPLIIDGQKHVILAINNITEHKKAEEELAKLNRMLRALSASNKAITRAQDESDCLNEVCRIIVKDCGYSMVWVGFAMQDEAKSVKPVAYSGFDEGYINSLNLTWADDERGRGPTGRAIRTNKVTVCRDMLNDSDFKPWRDEATKRGYASSVVFPLGSGSNVFGAITIYSHLPDAFSQREIGLLGELADDLAFGILLNRLRNELKESERELKKSRDELEIRVDERTVELALAQQEVDRAKRLSDIGTLAATVAHELRNPLAAIKMATYNIKRKAQNPILDKHLGNIDAKVEESEQIITNLLFYSRLKIPHYGKINIHNILTSCINEAAARFSRANVYVDVNVEAIKATLVEADPLQVKEVFSNIINNAYDALPEDGGRIDISGQPLESAVKIAVKDSGIGISSEDLTHVFEPFFTTKAKGTGLGLPVCRQIVNMHNGSIDIQSEKNKGTVVEITLPILQDNNG